MGPQNTGSVPGTATRPATTITRRCFQPALAVFCALFAFAAVNAAPIEVDSTEQSPGVEGDCTLAEAIKAANTDAVVDGCAAGSGADVLFLPARTYTLLSSDNSEGGAGGNGLPLVETDITFRAAPGPVGVAVIERSAAALNNFRVLQIGPTGVLRLNGITVRGGQVNGPGAGIFNNGGELFIENSAVSDNEALGADGGGIRNSTGTLTVTKSTLSGNSADSGGAISSNGNIAIIESTLSSNIASDNGGAIDNAAGTLAISKKTVLSSNQAGGNGGGIYNGGILTVLDASTLTENSADGSGGGIYNSGTSTLDRSTVSNNQSGVHGGGIYNSTGSVNINTATLSRNSAGTSAAGDGGGIFNASGGGAGVVVRNSAVIDNTARNGGGIFNAAKLALVNTTLDGNTAETSGGAVFSASAALSTSINSSTIAENSAGAGGGILVEPTGTPIQLHNTILADNSAPDGSDCKGDAESLDHNLIGDPGLPCSIGLAGNDFTGDAQLDDFAENGQAGDGHFNLTVISPALERGNDGTCTRTDQIGQPRQNICDIGAIEFQDVIPDAGDIEHKKARFALYYDAINHDLDDFFFRIRLSKSPLEEFEQPFFVDLEINIELMIDNEWHPAYSVMIPANTVPGIDPKTGLLYSKYVFSGAPPVRKVIFEKPLELYTELYVQVEKIELLESFRSQLEPQEYFETVLQKISRYKLSVQLGPSRRWEGTADLVVNSLSDRKISFINVR